MLTIYHNPRCKKSRAGLSYLQDNNIPHQVVEYLKHPLTEEQINSLLKKLQTTPEKIIRTQEKVYKEQFKGQSLTESQWIAALAEYPKMLQRPIVEAKEKAVLAQPPETIDQLL